MGGDPRHAIQSAAENGGISFVSNDYTFYHFPVIDSTNEEAKRLVAQGQGHAAVIWADRQTAGRGRRGREWTSPVGNLYCTVIEPLHEELVDAARLAYLYGIAIARAINQVVPQISAQVKWPNDVLIDRQKVAGVLLEIAECPVSGQRYLITGFGVNIADAPPVAAEALYKSTSIKAAGGGCTADELLVGVLANVKTLASIYRIDGFAAIRTLWCAHACGMGEAVTVNMPDGSRILGTFADLDTDGALVLDTDAGRRSITAGDVFFRPASLGVH